MGCTGLVLALLALLCLVPAAADDETNADSDAQRTAELRRSAQEKIRQIKQATSAGRRAPAQPNAQQLQRPVDTTHLASVAAEGYAEWLVDNSGGTVVVFFHAPFCKHCPPQLGQFAQASAVLAQRGYPGVLAALDTSLGGSAGAAPRLFAKPCVACPACTGYPCIVTIDIDAEGHSSGSLWGARPVTAELLATATARHLQQRGVQPSVPRNGEGSPAAAERVGASAQLHAAARAGNATRLAELLAAGADPNAGVATEHAEGGGGWTALHEVAARGHCVECAVLLAASGARVSSLAVRDSRGLAAADVARKAVRGSWDRVVAAEAESERQSVPVPEREL